MELATTPIGGSELLRFAASLIIVIGAVVVFGWLYGRSKSLGGVGNDAIEVVASKALGTRERLLLVEVADTQVLVGMTANQIQTLHIFDTPVVTKEKTPASAGFADRLRASVRELRR